MANLLTQPEVETLCRRVGFTAANARIASAIAMCEAPAMVNGVPHSNFGAIGDQTLATDVWGYSYGGFQIRSLRADKGTGRTRDELRLVDPIFNAAAARTIKLAAGGFSPWSTYTSGMYRAYLQDVFPPPPGTYVVVSGDTLSAIAQKVSGGKWTWQQLAAANGLTSPYTIKIGQTLLLPFAKAPGV
jgi:hypothetical protein